MNEEKWTKRVTEEDIKKAIDAGDMGSLASVMDAYQLQFLKDQQVKDADFEIIENKQLPNSELPLVNETNTNIPTDNRGA